MRICIITPSLNQLSHLRRCVASVRDQCVADTAIEQLVIDGGSTDGTVDWLRAEGLAMISEPDQGMYDALNKGLNQIRRRAEDEDLVWAWLNADEQYLPNALARVQQAFADETQLDLLCGGALLVDEDGHLLTYWKSMPLRALYLKAGILYNLSCGLFFRARVLASGIAFDARKQAASDLLFMQALLRQGVRSRCLPDYTSTYTFAPGNISNQPHAQAEHDALRFGGSLRVRAARWGIRLLKAAERVGRGTRRQRFPLSYAIYKDDFTQRTSFSSQKVPARWPRLPPAQARTHP